MLGLFNWDIYPELFRVGPIPQWKTSWNCCRFFYWLDWITFLLPKQWQQNT